MVIKSLTRNARLDALAAAIREHFADKGCELIEQFGELTLIVPAEQLLAVAWILRDHTVSPNGRPRMLPTAALGAAWIAISIWRSMIPTALPSSVSLSLIHI